MKLADARTPASELAEGRAAGEPPEARGLARDEVRLLVVCREGAEHARFDELGRFLEPGDLVVVNISAMIPAAVDGIRRGSPVVVHVSSPLEDGTWTVELRSPDGSGPILDGVPGDVVELVGKGWIEVQAAYRGIEGRSRILRVLPHLEGTLEDYLARMGRPISYSYLRERWPLSMYQTIFATEPGSAEMPSAGRPFTPQLVTGLVTRGVALAPVVLHTAVSSLDRGETPLPERFRVPAATARLVNDARTAGSRVVAVGTSVTRALESAGGAGGVVRPAEGWTDLVLGPDLPTRVVGGLVTGWHGPLASHRLLLESVAGPAMIEEAYGAALGHGYLWHEFGDSCLFLP